MWCNIVLSLVPTLFSIDVNYVAHAIGAFWKHFYAEDTVIYSFGPSLHSA